MNWTSAILGAIGGWLIGYGLSRIGYGQPGGWAYTLLGAVLFAAGSTYGIWGV
jgi:hypothetical protein